MRIGSHIDPDSFGPCEHGGDLAAARQMFPNAPEPIIDLSTGINPHPYPLPAVPEQVFARLPDRVALRRLAGIAARVYGAPSADCVVPAPGVQMLLPMVARLASPGRAAILAPTYAEHFRAAALAGHAAAEVTDIAQLEDAKLAVVVNPNNPDGRIVPKQALLRIAGALSRHQGILVVDEAFADVVPPEVSLAGETMYDNIVVLRSFGKFFGLAGLRLGFALAAPVIARQIERLLGPWPVSGPAILIGERALADEPWKATTLKRLSEAAQKLDRLLVRSGLEIIGGTSLYRLARSPNSHALFEHFGRAGIFVRCFAEHPTWLRWGLPRAEQDWQRLSAGLTAFHSVPRAKESGLLQQSRRRAGSRRA
jgi:cobalamin biosynthetic protein CobC